jgi:hypothetical protein
MGDGRKAGESVDLYVNWSIFKPLMVKKHQLNFAAAYKVAQSLTSKK